MEFYALFAFELASTEVTRKAFDIRMIINVRLYVKPAELLMADGAGVVFVIVVPGHVHVQVGRPSEAFTAH